MEKIYNEAVDRFGNTLIQLKDVEKQTFTRDEVREILVSVFVFAGANNNQGVKDIRGINYGEKAETVIKANESIEGTGILSIIQQFK